MKKKYRTEIDPETGLLRIIALRCFSNVMKGDFGGLIEKEENLSHEGDCWIYGFAKVYGDAKVYDNAWVSGNAKVYGNARIHGGAGVYGDAEVFDNAEVCEGAKVFGSAMVCGEAKVYGDAVVVGRCGIIARERLKVSECARISGKACVSDIADVFGNAQVSENAVICGNAKVGGNARIFGEANIHGGFWVFGDAKICGKVIVCNSKGNIGAYGNISYACFKVSGNVKLWSTKRSHITTSIENNKDYIMFAIKRKFCVFSSNLEDNEDFIPVAEENYIKNIETIRQLYEKEG